MGAAPAPLELDGHRLVFGASTLVMGIVNVTPDSFSGDGLAEDAAAAVRRAFAMAEAGAHIVDVGGESTRPGSQAVSADEEMARVLPVIDALAGRLAVPISIDTRKARVASAALDAGAHVVNDVWGLRGDAEMATVIASHPRTGVVVMHNQKGTSYRDLMADILDTLSASLAIGAAAGIAAERIIVDPGFGFAKTPAHNLELTRRLGELKALGRPILVGPSRKSTIGLLTDGAPPEQRLEGSIALATLAVAAGADLVRVHDVSATVRALRVVDAVVRGAPESVRELPIPGPTG